LISYVTWTVILLSVRNGGDFHAYLFETAKTIYLENKDAKLDEERSFSHAVLDDFKELEEAGITHPDMEKIKALPHHRNKGAMNISRRND
jgi:hypothetical protein